MAAHTADLRASHRAGADGCTAGRSCRRPGFPGADPGAWWGVERPSSGSAPAPGQITITGSSLEALLECPRRWFLSRRAKAEGGRQSRASIGDIVHLIARQAAEDGLTVDEMRAQLDRVWEQIPFEAEWLSATERSEIDEALDRFARYQASEGRDVVAVERGFRVPLSIEDREVVGRHVHVRTLRLNSRCA